VGKKKKRVKLRGDMYWMNKMCGCWTPIRDTHSREREVNGLKNEID
jgi:hypothetical protein